MKSKIAILILLIFILGGCQQEKNNNYSAVLITPTNSTASTNESQPRWKIYEQALSKTINGTENGLCEWKLLGVERNEVYVWAYCKVKGPYETTGIAPVVIYLGANREISKVVIPRDGDYYPGDIQKFFPESIQKEISSIEFDNSEAEKHINERMTSGGPPLIELAGTPLP